MISDWALMRDGDGLALNWYGPSTIAARVGDTPVTLRQDTEYPRNGRVTLTVDPDAPLACVLKLRIPYWSAATAVAVNGRPVSPVTPGCYLTLERTWRPGDVVELDLDLSLRYWTGERECAGQGLRVRRPAAHGAAHLTRTLRCPTLDAAPIDPAELSRRAFAPVARSPAVLQSAGGVAGRTRGPYDRPRGLRDGGCRRRRVPELAARAYRFLGSLFDEQSRTNLAALKDMATQERIRIALIGTGKRGRNVRLPAIRMMSDRFELAAVCDMHEQTARRVAAECGVPAYTRVQDLVAHERLDAAAISTPGDSHHAIGAYLAERGISIIVETPLAATLPLCDVLIEAVERNGVKLEVAEQYCRDPLHLMKRQIVEQGLIGDVLRVFALFQTDGCHIVSSLRMFLGDAAATRVGSVAMNSPIPRVNANAVRRFDTEEWNLQSMEFDSGATAVTSYSNLYHAQALGRKAKTLFQIDGTTGSIVEDDVHLTTEEQRLNGAGRATEYPIRTLTRDDGGTTVVERLQIDTDPPVVWENPWPQYRTNAIGLAIVEEMDSLAQAVAEDRPTRYDAHRARADIEISMAAAESWKPGRGPVESATARR